MKNYEGVQPLNPPAEQQAPQKYCLICGNEIEFRDAHVKCMTKHGYTHDFEYNTSIFPHPEKLCKLENDAILAVLSIFVGNSKLDCWVEYLYQCGERKGDLLSNFKPQLAEIANKLFCWQLEIKF
jgi:fructose-1,6-bisphosphatase